MISYPIFTCFYLLSTNHSVETSLRPFSTTTDLGSTIVRFITLHQYKTTIKVSS